MKTCAFINLPQSAARRIEIEASFAATLPAGWALSRFEATGPAEVADIPGGLLPTEKACFASHRMALGAHLDDEDAVLISEDDTLFSPQTFQIVDALLSRFPDWEVIFTDASICDFAAMIQMASRRDGMVERGEYMVLDLTQPSWCSASAYVVRGAAKRRLHAALLAAEALDRPYDVYLADLAHSGAFRIGACFPFLTAPSSSASTSQIRESGGPLFDSTVNAFRRLMWVGRDIEHCRLDAARLRLSYDNDTADLAAAIFGTIVSPAFPMDRSS